MPIKLAEGYAELCHAGVKGDRAHLERAAKALGFLAEADDPKMIADFLVLLEVATEPFLEEGVYDFGASDLPPRAREAALEMFLKHGFVRPPPAETLFIHRKLGGTFLLCTKLKARVDVRELIEPLLEKFPPQLA